MKRDISNLHEEDLYDDMNCSEYETGDYFDSKEDDATDVEHDSVDEKRGYKKNSDVETENFYTRRVMVERGEKSRARYARLAEIARNGTEEEKKQAKEDACLYMKGYVRDFIKRTFRTYVEKDPDYAEDLEQEAYFNIMKYLPEYKPERGLPSTFYSKHILSAMVSSINQMKHSISSSDASLQRKIKRIKAEFEKFGRKPDIADYMVETGETMSKIRSVLRMMNIDKNTHLEAIEEFDQLIAGDPTANSMYDTPENLVMKKIMFENILRRMHELFPQEEISIFLRNAIYGESIPTIAKNIGNGSMDDKVRRTIEKIRHAIAYDAEIRSLCSSYLKRDNLDMAVVTILPIEGEEENMDLLENIIL